MSSAAPSEPLEFPVEHPVSPQTATDDKMTVTKKRFPAVFNGALSSLMFDGSSGGWRNKLGLPYFEPLRAAAGKGPSLVGVTVLIRPLPSKVNSSMHTERRKEFPFESSLV